MDYFPSRTARKLILVAVSVYLLTNVVKDDLMKGVIILGTLYILLGDIEGIDNDNDGIEDDVDGEDGEDGEDGGDGEDGEDGEGALSVGELDDEITARETERSEQESALRPGGDNSEDSTENRPAVVSGNNVKSGGGEKGPDIKASNLNTGPYDGLCLKTGNKEYWMKSPDETSLVPNEGLYTYLSSQGPIKMKLSDQSALRGPPVDGVDGSAEKMFMFANNISSPLCCPSTFTTSTGCMCTTKNQRDFIASRGYLDDISVKNESVKGVDGRTSKSTAKSTAKSTTEPTEPTTEPTEPTTEPTEPTEPTTEPTEPTEPTETEPAVQTGSP